MEKETRFIENPEVLSQAIPEGNQPSDLNETPQFVPGSPNYSQEEISPNSPQLAPGSPAYIPETQEYTPDSNNFNPDNIEQSQPISISINDNILNNQNTLNNQNNIINEKQSIFEVEKPMEENEKKETPESKNENGEKTVTFQEPEKPATTDSSASEESSNIRKIIL
jgi:hypothetical protein